MKNKVSKKIQRLANEIWSLEREIQRGNNVEKNQNKIEKITNSLSFEEMIAIDEYLMSK